MKFIETRDLSQNQPSIEFRENQPEIGIYTK